jgi:hypothetical protein
MLWLIAILLGTLAVARADDANHAPHWNLSTPDSIQWREGPPSMLPGAKMAILEGGTYSAMPPKMTHFAWMEGETILQLSSIGPWEVVYVNPADDPRRR